MKIAIDLNDVVRDYSNNFVRYYLEGYNREFDLSEFEFWTKKSRNVHRKFTIRMPITTNTPNIIPLYSEPD